MVDILYVRHSHHYHRYTTVKAPPSPSLLSLAIAQYQWQAIAKESQNEYKQQVCYYKANSIEICRQPADD